MKTVAQYEFPYEAQLAQGRLANEGIMSQVMNEVSTYTCINAVSGIKLVVSDEDFDAAVALLSRDVDGLQEV